MTLQATRGSAYSSFSRRFDARHSGSSAPLMCCTEVSVHVLFSLDVASHQLLRHLYLAHVSTGFGQSAMSCTNTSYTGTVPMY